MKILAYTLLVIGLVMMVFGVPFNGEMGMKQGVALILGTLLIMIGLFIWSRVRLGIPVFTVTAKDKTKFQEMRRELNVWRLLARLLGGFAAIFFIAGVSSVVFADSSGKTDWRIAAELITIGLVLAFCARFLVKHSR